MYCLKLSKHEFSLSVPKLPFLLDAPTYAYNRRASLLQRSFNSVLRLELQMSSFSSLQVLTTRGTYNIAYLPVYLICLSICMYVVLYAQPLTADSSSLSLCPQQSPQVFSLRPPQSLPVPECPPPHREHHQVGATCIKLICTIYMYVHIRDFKCKLGFIHFRNIWTVWLISYSPNFH